MFHQRSRLKKDYDDFRRQPDHDKFIREQWTNEDSEINIVKEISSTFTSEASEHTEFFKRDYMDTGKCFCYPVIHWCSIGGDFSSLIKMKFDNEIIICFILTIYFVLEYCANSGNINYSIACWLF